MLVELESSAHTEIARRVVGGWLRAELLLVGTFHLSTLEELTTRNS